MRHPPCSASFSTLLVTLRSALRTVPNSPSRISASASNSVPCADLHHGPSLGKDHARGAASASAHPERHRGAARSRRSAPSVRAPGSVTVARGPHRLGQEGRASIPLATGKHGPWAPDGHLANHRACLSERPRPGAAGRLCRSRRKRRTPFASSSWWWSVARLAT
jgi:hypothetical protein